MTVLLSLLMTVIFCANTDLMVTWDNPNTDVKESVVYVQNVWTDEIVADTTLADTTLIFNLQPFPDNTYRLGVCLIDSAGNKSGILWSDSEQNRSGRFVLCKDTIIPLPPVNLTAKKL